MPFEQDVAICGICNFVQMLVSFRGEDQPSRTLMIFWSME
jgi:hypothetical protein